MAVIVSAYTYTLRDDAGNPRTHGWFLVELRDTYTAGGIVIDYSNYLSRVEQLIMNPASGQFNFIPKANDIDYPGDARSGRLQFFGVGSGAVTVNTSGVGVSVVSGTQIFNSGQLLSGNISGLTLTLLFSGSIAAQATAFISGSQQIGEVVSGLAMSGARARVFLVGR